MRHVEALLFLSREPLTSRRLAQLGQLADGTQARTLVRRLNQHYDGCGRAFRVEEVAGGYQLLTRPHLADWIRRLEHLAAPRRLSAPAMETLAVVAYRQPVMRAEVESIRGVDCGEILRQLLDRDLMRVSGRSDELGRPYLYATTRRFLQWFGLRNLDDLPRAKLRRCHAATADSGASSGEPIQAAADITDSESLRHDDKESPVSVSVSRLTRPNDEVEPALHRAGVTQSPRLDDDDFEQEEDAELEEEFDDEEDEDEDDEDEDLDEDEWEEVEDDEEEEEELDEEEEDWDDEDMDDWDDEDEDEDDEDEDWE